MKAWKELEKSSNMTLNVKKFDVKYGENAKFSMLNLMVTWYQFVYGHMTWLWSFFV